MAYLMTSILVLLPLLAAPRNLPEESAMPLSGSLLGVDDRPMTKAHVFLYDPATGKEIAETQTDRNGRFRLSPVPSGWVTIVFGGVDHEPLKRIMFLDAGRNRISMNIRLNPLAVDYSQGIAVRLRDRQLKEFTTIPLVRSRHEFSAVLPDSIGDTIRYQLLVSLPNGMRLVNGPKADEFIPDGEGDYISVLRKSGHGPRIVVPIDTVGNSRAAGGVSSNSALLERMLREQTAHEETSMELRRLSDPDAIKTVIARKMQEHERRIRGEQHLPMKSLLMMEYLDFVGAAYMLHCSIWNDTLLADIFEAVPPESSLWDCSPGRYIAALYSQDRKSHLQRVLEFCEVRGNNEKSAEMLYNGMELAVMNNDSEFLALCGRFLARHNPGSTWFAQGKRLYKADSKISPGAMIPDVTVDLLDGNGVWKSTAISARYVLIDFWATWCGPCIRDLQYLREAYRLYHDRGLEIVSISLDDSALKLEEFRKKNPMPWYNARLAEGYTDPVAKAFDVSAIPSPILVDRSGKILGTGLALRGPYLLSFLGKYWK